jgi:Tfp pilus assembly protein PilF
VLITIALLTGGCAHLDARHQADAAFRRAITAHVAGDEARAEAEYGRILQLGFATSAVWNNLAVIAVHRQKYRAARRLFGRALAVEPQDLVALTNYGVVSYWLSDFKEAERSLADARALRRELLGRIAPVGRTDWESERWGRATRPLDEVAARYLDRIARTERGEHVGLERGDLVASLGLRDALPVW